MAQWKHWQSEDERHGGGGGILHCTRASGTYIGREYAERTQGLRKFK